MKQDKVTPSGRCLVTGQICLWTPTLMSAVALFQAQPPSLFSTPAWKEKKSEVLWVALHAASTLQALTRVPERFILLPPIPIYWIWTCCCDPAGCCLRALIAVQENQAGGSAAIASHCFQPILSGTERWSISGRKRTITLIPSFCLLGISSKQ